MTQAFSYLAHHHRFSGNCLSAVSVIPNFNVVEGGYQIFSTSNRELYEKVQNLSQLRLEYENRPASHNEVYWLDSKEYLLSSSIYPIDRLSKIADFVNRREERIFKLFENGSRFIDAIRRGRFSLTRIRVHYYYRAILYSASFIFKNAISPFISIPFFDMLRIFSYHHDYIHAKEQYRKAQNNNTEAALRYSVLYSNQTLEHAKKKALEDEDSARKLLEQTEEKMLTANRAFLSIFLPILVAIGTVLLTDYLQDGKIEDLERRLEQLETTQHPNHNPFPRNPR